MALMGREEDGRKAIEVEGGRMVEKAGKGREICVCVVVCTQREVEAIVGRGASDTGAR